MLKRPDQRAPVVAGEGVPELCELALSWPMLFEYMTQTKYDDGSARTRSSLLLFTDGPLFKMMLKDPDSKLCCWVAGKSLSGLFAAMEAALGDPGHEWRVDRQQAGDTARRVKK